MVITAPQLLRVYKNQPRCSDPLLLPISSFGDYNLSSHLHQRRLAPFFLFGNCGCALFYVTSTFRFSILSACTGSSAKLFALSSLSCRLNYTLYSSSRYCQSI
ncbi:hypothetical protein BJX61DRAFT_176578 [Aspergillus egyptiacus]|nr:hypothetical protein BJX61DRAFT_176578 [Aspergillus egyptiacus]